MTPCERITRGLDRLGRSVTVTVGQQSADCRAIIVPLRYKNKQYLEDDVFEFGTKDNGRFVYIGPVTPDFSEPTCWETTRVRVGTHVYGVARADRIYFGREPAYLWAVLVSTTEV